MQYIDADMPSKGSPLANFLWNALMDNKYPDILFWMNKTEGVFCLRCICKYSKKWSQNEAKIFEDYHKLKPRNSEDKRQRLLLALKSSPCIETLKSLSSKEKKFYKFVNKIANSSIVSDSEMISCESEMVEISALSPLSSSVDVLCNELKHEVVETCFTNAEMNVSFRELKTEVIDITAEIPRSSDAVTTNLEESVDCAVSENEWMEDKNLETLLSEIQWDDVSSILSIGNEDFTVPDVGLDTSEYLNDRASQSIFSGYYDGNNSSSSSYPDFSDLSKDQNCPDDYDPVMDLFQSVKDSKTFDQLKNLKEKINLFSECSRLEVKDICSVDSNVVVKLFEKDDEVSKDMDHNYYMMSLRTSKS
ncbi:uncharacterized protein TNCT_291521 [Trichonephila clavata]|uniref:IRF tryptophan pentad repeat domain-containing protein n=1 Tax=Trichonephila clavata TaxID=2740835 RepID=A0A8X6M3E2_TRICU|nr:uncharacterized protein TNCT_291521 [Trichonephila clavata]